MEFNFNYCPGETLLQERNGKLYFTGYAAVWGNKSPETEMFLTMSPEGKQITETFCRSSILTDGPIELWFNHNQDWRLGSTETNLELEETDKGLFYRCEYNEDDPDHRAAKVKYSQGLVKGSSFAFTPLSASWESLEDRDTFKITKASCSHISPVFNPAYSGTSSQLRSSDAVPKAMRGSHQEYCRNILRSWKTWKLLTK